MLERYLHRRGSEIDPIQVVGVPLFIYGNLYAPLKQKISDTVFLLLETFLGLPMAIFIRIQFYQNGNTTISKCLNSQTVLDKNESRSVFGYIKSFIDQLHLVK